MNSLSVLDVAIGVVVDSSNQKILISKRHDNKMLGGLWEFPGGKVESGEEPLQALERELQEEVGIHVFETEPLLTIAHDYPQYSVVLHVWWIDKFSGTPSGCEGQEVRWVDWPVLQTLTFPAANQEIIEKIAEKLSLYSY